MKKIKITKEQARRYMILYQGLGSLYQKNEETNNAGVEHKKDGETFFDKSTVYEFHGKEGILKYIKRASCIQYDSLNIVGRNSELVLQSRVSEYTPKMLEELLYTQRKLIDGLDKEMSIYSVEDWPHFKRHRDAAFKRHGSPESPSLPFVSKVRDEIKKRGPLSSIDLDFDQVIDWSWSPTRASRAALESMYLWGELIIHHKVNTRKVYDFSYNHISKEILDADDPNKTIDEYYQWHVLRRIGAVGLLWNRASEAWLRIPGLKSSERNKAIEGLLRKKKIKEIEIEGINYKFYIRSSDIHFMQKALENELIVPRTSIIAPLDNMMWDRKLISELFNFDYRWEVYKPVEERKYGYYVLPVLYRDKFIARFEPGKDKETGALVIKNWWWEPGIVQNKMMKDSINRCFNAFLNYLGTDKLIINSEILKQNKLEFISQKQNMITDK